MATISDRDDADTLSDGDHMLVRQPSATGEKTRKISFADLKAQIPGTGGSGAQAGKATLASGSVVVSATWVTANSRIVALPTATPVTPGTTLYCDPADFVNGVSFTIKSDDATDARDVFWLAAEEGVIALYVSFTAAIHDAINDYDLIHIGFDDNNYAAVYNDTLFTFYGQVSGSYGPDTSAGGPTIALDTTYTLDMRIVFNGDGSVTLTARVDGTELTSPITFNLASITYLRFGGMFGPGDQNETLDDLKIGTTDWGSSDLFSADFNDFSIVPPFDSTTGTGLDASSGALVVTGAANSYGEKALVFP